MSNAVKLNAAPAAPVVSGCPRTKAHRVFEKNAQLIWATLSRRFPAVAANPDLSQEAWSAGAIGLLRAAERFDAQKGVAFSTYGTIYIEGEIRKFLQRRSGAIKRPDWLSERAAKVRRRSEAMSLELGRDPTAGELAADLGLSPAEIDLARDAGGLFSVASLDEPVSAEEGSAPLTALIPDTCAPSPGSRLLSRAGFADLVSPLGERHRRVIEGLYLDEDTPADLAAEMGIPRHRVNSMHREALGQIRRSMAA